MLLAAFDERRPTADVDLLATAVANDVETISAFMQAVLAIEVDDGVVFERDDLRAQVIRDTDPYTGVRITVPARIDRTRHPLRVDINVGDPVTPAPVDVSYPSLLGDPFEIVGYPLETVLAEKIVTMIDRGDATTRDRDFADVYVLTGRHEVDAEQLAAAIGPQDRDRATRRDRVRKCIGPGRACCVRSGTMAVMAQDLDLIDTDPAVLHGQARFRGTRVPVSVVLDCLAAGMTAAEIADQYPSLPADATRAALA